MQKIDHINHENNSNFIQKSTFGQLLTDFDTTVIILKSIIIFNQKYRI